MYMYIYIYIYIYIITDSHESSCNCLKLLYASRAVTRKDAVTPAVAWLRPAPCVSESVAHVGAGSRRKYSDVGMASAVYMFAFPKPFVLKVDE
jgi:hypothetical protein